MLNSTEFEIYHAHNVKMPKIVAFLSLISMLKTTSQSLKAKTVLFFFQNEHAVQIFGSAELSIESFIT